MNLRGFAIVALLMASPASAQTTADPAAERAALQEARVRADYASALEHARTLLDHYTSTDAGAPTIADARATVDGLVVIAGLSSDAQDSLALADALQSTLSDAFRSGDTEVAATAARRQLDLRRRFLPGSHFDTASSLSWLSLILRNQGEFAEAESTSRAALAQILELYGREHIHSATAINALADLLRERGDLLGAEVLLREALQLRLRLHGPDSFTVAGSHNNLANVLGAQGRPVDAEEHFRRAIGIVRIHRGDRDPLVATALRNLANVLQEQGRLDDAEAVLLESQSIYEESESDRGLARTLLALGNLNAERGQTDAAIDRFRRGLELSLDLHGPDHDWVAATRSRLGESLARRGEDDAARTELEEVLRVQLELFGPHHASTVATRIQLARLAWTNADLDTAAKHLDAAVEGYEVARLRAAADWKRATARIESPYPLRAAVLLGQGRQAAAWEAVERSRARVLGELIERSGARERNPDLQLKVAAAESKVAALRKGAAPESDLRAARNELLAAELAWSRWQSERVEAMAPRSERSLAAADTQSDLPSGEALLGWLEVADSRGRVRRWATWLTAARVSFLELPADPGPVEELSAQLSGSKLSALGLSVTKDFSALVAAVRKAWLAPVLAADPKVDSWTVVPSGAMLSIPVEALLAGADRVEVRYAPSAALALARAEPRPASTQRAFFLGDPPFSAEFSPLPYTRTEIEDAAPTFASAELVLGADANEAALWKRVESGELAKYDVLHFATHAVPDDAHPEASALILAAEKAVSFDAVVAARPFLDGRVTAGEILASWKLDADLVTLSACGTGLGRKVAGEGTLGLSFAFLHAGSRSLLVSLWDVDDEATARFMQRFYANRAKKMSKVAAVQEARHWLASQTDGAGRRPFAHPHFWSAFVLIGEGR